MLVAIKENILNGPDWQQSKIRMEKFHLFLMCGIDVVDLIMNDVSLCDNGEQLALKLEFTIFSV